MPEILEDILTRLAVLEDKEAIRTLKSRYLRACDLKEIDTIRNCFLPGSVLIAYENFPVFTNPESFLDVFKSMACAGGVYDIHHATNWEIDIVGPDEARGRWSLNFRTILMETRQITRLAVEYDDVYRREHGRWWISETRSRVTSIITEQMDDDGHLRVLTAGEIPGAA